MEVLEIIPMPVATNLMHIWIMRIPYYYYSYTIIIL